MKRNFITGKSVLKPKKKSLFLSFILSLFFAWNVAMGQKAVITEEVKTIKTYPFSDPNPIPSFAINAKVSPYYPYFVFDGSTDKGINKEWKVVTLENDFIIVTVLPEAGGKVWGAIEKSTGKEFIYQNHVMKFRSIGIRGPWTSGGIEHNFGLDLGHAPWTASPVDYILKENADGSVSCIVGGLDLASRTQWRVKINLPKDKAFFETESMWYNPTPLHDAYLSWEVAAYKASNDLEFYFPGTVHIGHDGLVSQWPVDKEGHKLSVYKENNFGTSKSYHVFGMYPNWFGGYFHDSEFGSAHWSSYDDSPGKKLWIWSLARDGAIWEDLLTDNDGQYIEAQSGAYFNQPSAESGYNSPFNQLLMRPYYTETKSDFWFPVKGTEGMVDANPNGTLNLITLKDSLKITYCPNVKIQDSLIILLGNQVLLKEFMSLNPLQVYKKTIPFSESDSLPIRVNIGHNLLNYTSDRKDNEILRPVKTPAGQDFNSAEHLFRMAEDVLSMRNYSEALKIYLACLEKEPTHSRALTKVAELCYRKGQFDEGLKYARKVLENNTYDGGANFIYGIIQKAIGNYTQAEEAFSVAIRTMEFRSAAYVEIAGLQMRKQNFSKAVIYAKKALDYNRFNITAYQFLATSYRKQNLKDDALKTADALLEIDPLNHYARFEQYMLNPTSINLDNLKSNIRNEFPYETYLELALEYINQGQNDEAVQVLEQSPSYPTVYYWLAYLYRDSSHDKSTQFLKQAEAISPFLVFPYRLETISVLQWAQTMSSSWKTDYYLGLIFWNIQQTKKAKQFFSKCGDTPDYPGFYIARGILFQEDKSKYADVENDFKHAQKLGSKEWRTWFYLNKFYENSGDFTKQLETTKLMYPLFADNPVVGITHAKALLSTGNYQECLKVLAKLNILPQEGAQEGHDIFELANLSIAVKMLEQNKYKEALKYVDNSKHWPENLGAGKPYEPDSRLQDYISAYCYTRLGDNEQAENYFQKVIRYSEKNWGNSLKPENIYIANQVFSDHVKQKDAAFFMENWNAEQDSLRDWKISAGSSAPKAQWMLAKYSNDKVKSDKLEKEIATIPSEIRFRLILKTLAIINEKNK